MASPNCSSGRKIGSPRRRQTSDSWSGVPLPLPSGTKGGSSSSLMGSLRRASPAPTTEDVPANRKPKNQASSQALGLAQTRHATASAELVPVAVNVPRFFRILQMVPRLGLGQIDRTRIRSHSYLEVPGNRLCGCSAAPARPRFTGATGLRCWEVRIFSVSGTASPARS